MDILDFREYVLSLYDVEETTPFDDSTLVYKVAGKWFVVADMDDFTHIVIHHSPEVGEALRDKYPQITPAWISINVFGVRCEWMAICQRS